MIKNKMLRTAIAFLVSFTFLIGSGPSLAGKYRTVPWLLLLDGDGLSTEILPEIYTLSIETKMEQQFRNLFLKIPLPARYWVLNMGWGLEDLTLDSNEVSLLEVLRHKNASTARAVMTRPDIIDGVTETELVWAIGFEISSITELLNDDISDLQTLGMLSEVGLDGINKLVGMAVSDVEIAKGFHLIENTGRPNTNLFGYSVPSYNTQVYILGRLVELGIPTGYEVAAIAAALDYGSLWTIANAEVRAMIPSYAHAIILYQSQTDHLMQGEPHGRQKTFLLKHR